MGDNNSLCDKKKGCDAIQMNRPINAAAEAAP